MPTVAGKRRKPPTLQDLADQVGLHTSTVSLALSGKGTISDATRQRVLTAARTLGYRPNPLAQRLARSGSDGVVCILSSPLDLGLSTQKLVLVQDGLVARSLEVPLYTYAGPGRDDGDAQASRVEQLCRQRPRAIVCAGSAVHPSAFPELEAYQRQGGILVSYDLPTPLACDRVIYDREDNAYKAARHLLEAGHTKIGFSMSAPPAWSAEVRYLPWTSRLKGFRRALEEFGAPLREEWLFFHDGAYEEGGEDLARRFLAIPERERPTGLCVVNDYVAMAFLVEATRAGVRVPADLSLVGHDNQPIAALCPVPLTAASHPAEEIARAVVGMLAERIEGYDGPPRTQVLTGEIVPRASVAAPPAR